MNKPGKASGRQALAEWMSGIKSRIESTLGAMLEKRVTLSLEPPRKLQSRDFDAILQEGPVAISLHFGPDIGWHLLLPQSLAGAIADIASTGDGSAIFNLDVHSGTLQEIFGQVEADIEPEIALVIGAGVDIAPVEVSGSADAQIASAGGNPAMVGHIEIEGLASQQLIILFEQGFTMQFSAGEAAEESPQPAAKSSKTSSPAPTQERPSPPRQQPSPVARPAEFEDFGSTQSHKAEKNGHNIDSLLDISLPIIIELGRSKMLIREILDLGPGSVIELDKLSGEPVDLYVNDKKFARGEVVVIEENFGVRITELIKVEERLRALK